MWRRAGPASVGHLHSETVKLRTKLPPLLVNLADLQPPRMHYLGVSFGLTTGLLGFWHRCGFKPVYLRQTPSEVTGPLPCPAGLVLADGGHTSCCCCCCCYHCSLLNRCRWPVTKFAALVPRVFSLCRGPHLRMLGLTQPSKQRAPAGPAGNSGISRQSTRHMMTESMMATSGHMHQIHTVTCLLWLMTSCSIGVKVADRSVTHMPARQERRAAARQP